jgi:hypothetical protein
MRYRSQIEFLQEAKDNGLDRDEAMDALRAYRSEGNSFEDEAPQQQEQAPQQEEEKPGLGSRVLGAVGKGLEYVGRYTSSPVVTALAKTQEGLAENGPMPSMKDVGAIGRGLMAGARQFGRPTSEGATGRDIAGNMGLSGAAQTGVGLMYDIALDPTNLIPGKAIAAPIAAGARALKPVGRALAPIGSAIAKAGSNVGEFAGHLAKGGLAKMSGMTREALETAVKDPDTFRTAREMAKNLPGAEAAAAQQLTSGLQTVTGDALSGIERTIGTPRPDLAYQSGRNLYEASKKAADDIGERFGQSAGEIIENVKDRGLQYRGRVNAAAARLRDIARGAGVDVTGGTAKSQVPLASNYGGKAVLDQEASILQRVAAESVGIEKVEDLLALRRGLDARIYAVKSTPDGAALFTKATGGSKAADDMRAALNQTLGEHIALKVAETAPKGRGAAMASLARAEWETANEIYSTARKAVESVDEVIGANVGKDVEKMVQGLNRLGVDDLKHLKKLSKADPIIKPLFSQIGDSFIDGMVIHSSKAGSIDVSELKKTWNALGASRDILFDKKRIAQIEDAIKRFDDVKESTSLLGTPGVLSRARSQVASGGALRKATGQSVSADPIKTQLAALDQMLNLTGDASLLRQAQALNLAKGIESGVSRLQTGALLGGGLAGYQAGESQGGVPGGLLGAIAGMAATSPAGAIAAYRLMAKTKSSAGKIAQHGKNVSSLAKSAAPKAVMVGRRALDMPYRAGVLQGIRSTSQEDE